MLHDMPAGQWDEDMVDKINIYRWYYVAPLQWPIREYVTPVQFVHQRQRFTVQLSGAHILRITRVLVFTAWGTWDRRWGLTRTGIGVQSMSGPFIQDYIEDFMFLSRV